jgi:quinol monooxygenase YgiN
MSVTAIYSFQAADGKADELVAMLQQGRDFSMTVEGCECFEVFQGKDDPNKFVMTERWASVEDHRSHFETSVKASGVLEHAEALMTEPFPPPDESYYLLR